MHESSTLDHLHHVRRAGRVSSGPRYLECPIAGAMRDALRARKGGIATMACRSRAGRCPQKGSSAMPRRDFLKQGERARLEVVGSRTSSTTASCAWRRLRYPGGATTTLVRRCGPSCDKPPRAEHTGGGVENHRGGAEAPARRPLRGGPSARAGPGHRAGRTRAWRCERIRRRNEDGRCAIRDKLRYDTPSRDHRSESHACASAAARPRGHRRQATREDEPGATFLWLPDEGTRSAMQAGRGVRSFPHRPSRPRRGSCPGWPSGRRRRGENCDLQLPEWPRCDDLP